MAQGDTTYSAKIPGNRGNFNRPVRLDMTDGFLGISQYDGEELKDRVLLSPEQAREVIAFAKSK